MDTLQLDRRTRTNESAGATTTGSGSSLLRTTPLATPAERLILVMPEVPGSTAAHAPRSLVPHKGARVNLRRQYPFAIQFGFIAALLLLIGLFHLPMRTDNTFENIVIDQEVVQMEEILQTKQIEKPPPPPRPMAPVAVADNALVEEIDLNLDASLDIGAAVSDLPPPPPAAEVEEEAEEEEIEVFVAVEEMPELIGGIAAIQKSLTYPEMARLAQIEGRVIVQFIVDEEGNVIDPVVLRGIGGGCDEEAVRAVKAATFKPGKQRGKAVRVRYSIPVTFRLN